jgi:hypothetical protein
MIYTYMGLHATYTTIDSHWRDPKSQAKPEGGPWFLECGNGETWGHAPSIQH